MKIEQIDITKDCRIEFETHELLWIDDYVEFEVNNIKFTAKIDSMQYSRYDEELPIDCSPIIYTAKLNKREILRLKLDIRLFANRYLTLITDKDRIKQLIKAESYC